MSTTILLTSITATLLVVACDGMRLKETIHFTIPYYHDHGDHISSLFNDGSLEYHKSSVNSDLTSNRFTITIDGRLYANSALNDLAGRTLRIPVSALDVLTGVKSRQDIVLHIDDDKLHRPPLEVDSRIYSRSKRAAEVSITKLVMETVDEITLDYASVGVIENNNNRFFLEGDDDLPLTSINDVSGKLIVDMNRRLDYETAPSHEYRFTVFINNTNGNNEYIVSVTIQLRDVNDEKPVFMMQPSPYLAVVNANLPPNSKVDYNIIVQDTDQLSSLSYSLTEGGSKFRINQNGELFTTDALNAGQDYSVRVKVEDTNAEIYSQLAFADISIRAGHRPPQFYQSHYETSVPENVQGVLLDVVIQVKSFQGDALSFAMAESQIFMIEESPNRPNEAKIRLTSRLDYETDPHSYDVDITATERGTAFSSTVKLTVTLTDINDNSPRFDISEYVSGDIWKEDVEAGTAITTVRAIDLDPADSANGQITYSLQWNSPIPLPFRVQTRPAGTGYEGIIKVSGKLDYDTTERTGYRFKVIATDHGSPARSSSAYVRVQVQNTNDEAPAFASTRLERIEATKSVNSVVTTVLASDPDGDKVTYAIASTQPPSSPFIIDSETGSISLTADLTSPSYVDKSSFTLNVSATDDGSCCSQDSISTNVGYVLVIIEIVGRNHAPEFPNCALYSNIARAPENTNNAFVIRVNATDQDVGPNGEIRYSLIVNDANLFRIDENTGEIWTKVSSIDREATSQITITVKAEDGAQSKLSSFCTFTMMVEDLNDNDPSLSLPSAQDAAINSPVGTTIYTIFAFDPDFGQFGTTGLTYRVVGNNNFRIDGQNIENTVVLSSSLPSTQTMQIVVTDGGGRSKTVDFTVNIRQTAALPVFTSVPESVIQILENLTDDTIIARIKAESATGGPVNYYLVPTTTLDAFYMLTDNVECNNRNELCLAVYQSQNLDADELRFYKLRVRVTPQSTGSNVVAERTIDIELLDVNDNIPVFENIDDNGYIIGSVDENTTVINRQVVVLKANDSDITPIYKTQLYSLEPGPNAHLFRVEPLTGVVRVNQDVMFDRENISQYVIKVKATDGAPSTRPQAAGQPNSQVSAVQININDINDNAPYFPRPQYNGSVEETASRGELVRSVRAEDSDIDNNFEYNFLSGNENQAFEITDTGDLLVFDTARLDYETQKIYNMRVEVSDGRFQAQTNVHIVIVDVNDNVPEFSQKVYSVTNVYEEDTSVTTSNRLPIVRVSATDADIDRPNDIRYGLSGSYSDRFQIDSISGQVYLVSSLDRDSQPQWDVNVLANDEFGTPTNRIGYAIISVFPKDINDNYPIFVEETLTAMVNENGDLSDPNYQANIMTIRANDKDEGNNGSVKFRMKDSSVQPSDFPLQSYPFFNINEFGVVSTLVSFDRETIDRYTVEVIAYDEGNPTSKSATATATIIIEDVNDNPPRFSPKFYHRRVSELVGPLSFIIQVDATDVDIRDTLYYTLDDEAKRNFSIDGQGNIYIRDQQRLDFEHFYEARALPHMNITVKVDDGKFNDTAMVQITVVDENDETPLFDPSSVTVNLLENVTIDRLVHTFLATDRDALSTPRNSEIEYLIDRTSSSDFDRYFKIDATNGEVRTQKSLDRETLATHTVKILAIDNGFPVRRTGTATLIVNLDDINDNGPRLVDPVVYIEENMPVDSYTRPRMIKAVDDDDDKIGHGPPFKMKATNGSQNSLELNFIFHEDWDIPAGLSVPNGAGELRTKEVLDREGSQGPEIDFYLELSDKMELSDVRLLTVVVADEDDNPPSPGHRDALVYNYKAWPRNYTVVEIGDCYAEDKDDWDKPYKTYESVGEWQTGFSIDRNSGMISADLTVLPSGVYNFKCKVIDNYIKDTRCAFNCNVANGTATQTETCKNDCREEAEAISTVTATIKSIDEGPVWGGASIRLKGSALDFVKPRSNGRSPYDVFISRMASSLGTEEAYIDVFSVLDASEPGFVDVRFTAHGSPYYNSTKLIGAVLSSEGLSDALGMTIAQVPVNECLKEVCDGGCTNVLVIADEPTLVNANGSSLLGITSKVMAECRCDVDDGSSPLMCSPESCLNGGVCVYNKDSQTTSCDCPKLFDGPRCQQLRHSFSGDGWAQYKTLAQCGNGTTSLELLTRQLDGVLLYNGPDKNPGTGADAITDYLLVAVSNGRPVVYVNYGTGHVKLTINTIINDGAWHKLELSKVDRSVILTLDDCENAQIPDTDTSNVDGARAICQDTKPTPGENRFLNVATLLELGGRAGGGNAWWPSEVERKTREAYNGCVRNVLHNGELYDLFVGNVGRQSNSQDGCPREDSICIDSNGSPACGANGLCEAFRGVASCTCKPGWRGDRCSVASEYMDFARDSFVIWEMLYQCQGSAACSAEKYTTSIELSFRSRDADNNGLLFLTTGDSGAEYIKLMIVDGRLQLRYDIGSDSIDITRREQIVSLPVTVTDGALHRVTVSRVGKRFTLQMDGGEGRYFAQHEDVYSHQLFNSDERFFAGADGPFRTSDTDVITSSTDLDNFCLVDVRFNGKWFPANAAESAQTADVRMERRHNVSDGCASDGCKNINCPGKQQCKDLWRDYECRCPSGYLTLYTTPYCEDVNECFPDTPCFNGQCENLPGSFKCNCDVDDVTGKIYTGELCNVQGRTSPLGLASSGVAALLVSILLALLIAVAIFFYVTRRSSIQKGESLIEPYNDIRETIYNYDEEGMPEEDQDGYDISRLSKPVHPSAIQPVTDKLLGRAPMSRQDQPDVGDFINGRLNDADGDPTNCPGDELKDYAYEGNGSDAGSLSSLNSSSSGGDQDFDYLNDWGPKFTRLADMYGGGDEA